MDATQGRCGGLILLGARLGFCLSSEAVWQAPLPEPSWRCQLREVPPGGSSYPTALFALVRGLLLLRPGPPLLELQQELLEAASMRASGRPA